MLLNYFKKTENNYINSFVKNLIIRNVTINMPITGTNEYTYINK